MFLEGIEITVTGAVVPQTIYWIAAGCVIYPYLVYPAVLVILSHLRSRPVRRSGAGDVLPSVSVVVSAYNEEIAIARRLRELIRHILDEGLDGEIVIVSDGSTDSTVEVARGFGSGKVPVTVVVLSENGGKSAAISVGCRVARHEILALGDVRQSWAPDALTRMLENFADPEVGAVGGELFVESAPGVMAGVGLYWRYEKWLRRREGMLHSTVGVTGAISAVRRSLFRPIMPGTVLDDVYWPLQVSLQGYRVVFDGRAHAFDRLPERVGAELKRKVRTLAGNFQVCSRVPDALNPARNPVWFALISHKLMRLVVPWALLVTGVLAAVIGGPLYNVLLAAQLSATAVGLLGLWEPLGSRSRVAGTMGSFLLLNTAAFLGFWVWLTGRTSRSWTKTTYRHVSLPSVSVNSPTPTLEGAARWG